MSYNLNSLKGVIWGIIYGTTTEVIRGDTRSLDYSSYRDIAKHRFRASGWGFRF